MDTIDNRMEMKDIAIYGAGGFGREEACHIIELNKAGADWNLIGFFDDGIKKGTAISHYGDVLGGINELNKYPNELAIAIAIGNPEILKKVHTSIINRNLYFPNLISSNFGVFDEKTFKIGEGNIIRGGCWASCDVSIGNFNIFNGDIILGHDVVIGNYNALMPAIHVSGEVTIGERNLIGVGSIILQQVKIGNGVHLGAGAVLMTKPKDNNTYLGNPAKLFKY